MSRPPPPAIGAIMMIVDLTDVPFEDWVRFVFDHPISPAGVADAWHWDVEYVADNASMLSYCTRLFAESRSLLTSYSPELLEQGFWFIPGPNGFMRFLADESVLWRGREECINAIELLFRNLFSINECGTACAMWWDSYVSYCGYGRNDIATDKKLCGATIRVVLAILRQDATQCRHSAVHGLHHLVGVNPEIRRSVASALRRSNMLLDIAKL